MANEIRALIDDFVSSCLCRLWTLTCILGAELEMANHHRFRFPIGPVNGPSIARTYASVTQSIMNRIYAAAVAGHRMVEGRAVCPPDGHFVIVLYPRADSQLGPHDRRGKVRLCFSYPNMYLQAFEGNGVWRPFSDADNLPDFIQNAAVAPVPLPFQSGYHNGGMGACFTELRFGHESVIDIYKTLSRHPHFPGGTPHLKRVLSKCCVLFPEGMRFPWLRRSFIRVMGGPSTVTVEDVYPHFNRWEAYCDAIRAGSAAFQPLENPAVNTWEELLFLVGLLLVD
jgi:hypothetical protein